MAFAKALVAALLTLGVVASDPKYDALQDTSVTLSSLDIGAASTASISFKIPTDITHGSENFTRVKKIELFIVDDFYGITARGEPKTLENSGIKLQSTTIENIKGNIEAENTKNGTIVIRDVEVKTGVMITIPVTGLKNPADHSPVGLVFKIFYRITKHEGTNKEYDVEVLAEVSVNAAPHMNAFVAVALSLAWCV